MQRTVSLVTNTSRETPMVCALRELFIETLSDSFVQKIEKLNDEQNLIHTATKLSDSFLLSSRKEEPLNIPLSKSSYTSMTSLGQSGYHYLSIVNFIKRAISDDLISEIEKPEENQKRETAKQRLLDRIIPKTKWYFLSPNGINKLCDRIRSRGGVFKI